MKNTSSICLNPNLTSLCIGKFDGVHIAHQKLLAKADSQQSGVLVIDFGFSLCLTPNQEQFITLPIYKVQLEEVKGMGAQEFKIFLKERFPNLTQIIIGYDFRFGKNRAYTWRDLEGEFEVYVLDEVRLEGESIHRQGIIQALQNGEILKANAMLGRAYHIGGEVIRGQGRGSKECVATLNLISQNYILPKSGVYASLTEIKGEKFKSVSFLGHRLSADGEFAIETHLLDDFVCIAQDLEPRINPWNEIKTQNKKEEKEEQSHPQDGFSSPHLNELESQWGEVKIIFIDFLRENQQFDSLALLKEQIQKDIKNAREILKDIKRD